MKSFVRAQYTRFCTTQLVLTLMFLSSGMLFAQHGIGTNQPNANAALHVNGVNQGVLLPKTALVSSTQFLAGATATTADNGMVVYNTSTTSLNGLSGEGYYVWQGGATGVWDRLITAQKGVYANIRSHSTTSSITWTEDDYCVVVTNNGISTSASGGSSLYLPDATLYPGRIVAIHNASTPAIQFGPNTGTLAPLTPHNFSAIAPFRGAIFISDGNTWRGLSLTF